MSGKFKKKNASSVLSCKQLKVDDTILKENKMAAAEMTFWAANCLLGSGAGSVDFSFLLEMSR
jgi:hypothetical protein